MQQPVDLACQRRERGFSLVETIAALGILSLAAVPLMQLSTEAAQNTGRLEARLLARTTAENVLARTIANPEPLNLGQTAGVEAQLGRTYQWELIVYPTERDTLRRLEVQVSEAGREQTLARLVALKTIRQETGER